MKFASVCSGIESATVAWHPLGWEPVLYSEIAAFPCALLSHHYPHVPNLGDMLGFRSWPHADFDVLVGGTPCQSFSVAGFREGISDPRGNLALVYLEILRRYRPRWFVWENVPGVLSLHRGRDFGSFLGGLAELGYGYGWRTLDAQFFGVPQRRRRVFVVGCLGSWARPAAVLFEPDSLRGNTTPRGKTRTHSTGTLTASARRSSPEFDSGQLIAGTLIAGTVSSKWKKGAGGPAGDECYNLIATDTSGTILASTKKRRPEARTAQPLVAYDAMPARGEGGSTVFLETDVAASLRAVDPGRTDRGTRIVSGPSVRRFTPLECERLQGFPDNYTLIPYRGKLAADSPRYEAIGNAIAIPPLRWLGERIAFVDQL